MSEEPVFKGLYGMCRHCDHTCIATVEDNPDVELHYGWHDCPNCGAPMWVCQTYEVPWEILPKKRRAS